MGIYNNPIIPGFNPDPSLVRVGPDYFLVTSTFEYFPGVPIYHTKDLIRWELIGHALTRRSQLDVKAPEVGGGVWAPTIRWHRGVFYVTTACFDRYRPQADERVWPRGFYVKTTNIWDSSTWSDPIYFDALGFDQDLFWDTDSTVYLSTTYRTHIRTPNPTGGAPHLKDFAVHTTPIDLATGRSLARPRVSRTSTSGVAEGAHIYRRGGWCYLLTAEGGTEGGHREVVCRSKAGPLGPWEEGPRGLWAGGERGEVERTGHADLVEGLGGQWWGVFLGVRGAKDGERSVFGRETFLVPVTWTADDWPLFNNGQPVSLQSEAPGLYRLHDQPKSWRDDFSADSLQLGWYRKNTPLNTNDIALTPANNNKNHLRLRGTAYPLSSPACPTLLLRKQTRDADSTTWRAKLARFGPDVDATPMAEAGAVVYWNHGTFASVGVCLSEGKGRVVRFSRPVGAEEGEVVEVDGLGEGPVVLVIRSRGEWYELGFWEVGGEEEEEVRWLGRVSKRVMTRDPEVGAAFTGMMFGVYAFGDCLTPADFEYVECA